MTHWTEKLIDQTASRKTPVVMPVVGYGVAAAGSLTIWAILGALMLCVL